MDILNIKELIEQSKTGLYYIDINDKEIMKKKLDEVRSLGILEANSITYTYTVYESYIALVIFKSTSFKNMFRSEGDAIALEPIE